VSCELTHAERSSLQINEDIIKDGLAGFVKMGEAFLDIRDNRQYRETHERFEDYCRDRWGISRRRANQLVGAAKVVGNLGTVVPMPTSERLARPLTRLPVGDQQEAWVRAVESAGDGPVTAKHVEVAVGEVLPPDNNKARDPLDSTSNNGGDGTITGGESLALFNLKRDWNKAGKRDRTKFMEWINENNN